MSGFRVEGNTSGNVAEVDSGNHLLVNLGKTLAQAGYGITVSENDAGSITGTPLVVPPETSQDFRLRTGLDTVLLYEAFSYTAQNSSNWKNSTTTQTVTFAGGFTILNASSLTTTTTGVYCQTWKVFPLLGGAEYYIEFEALLTQVPQANNVCELGAFQATAATTTTLLDGIGFRYDATGTLKAFLNFGGSEITSSAITPPANGVVSKYGIIVGNDNCSFWIDDVLVASIPTPTSVGTPFQSVCIPVAMRLYNVGVPALAQQLKVAAVTVSQGDYSQGKPFAHIQAGQGMNAIQGTTAMTMGSTCNYVNSTVPASAALSNTAGGYNTLGGQFQFVAVAGAETDYALFAFQVPLGTTTAPGRNLYITGVAIDTFNNVVPVATTATVLQWSLGIGGSAASLATSEAAGTKQRRVLPLGIQSFAVGAAVGAVAPQIVASFQTPMYCNQGEIVQVILKMPVATATATEIFRGLVRIEGYWE